MNPQPPPSMKPLGIKTPPRVKRPPKTPSPPSSPLSPPPPPSKPHSRDTSSGGGGSSSRQLSMAVGGTVPGLMLRKPTSHAMAGVTSFMPHYKGMSHSFNPTNQNFAQATFAQGGYFPEADHRLI